MDNIPIPIVPPVRVAALLPRSRANGPGLRAVVWVQGCPFRCPGCFNPAFLPSAGGTEMSAAGLATLLLADPAIEGVSFSGGEPFAQAPALALVAERAQAAGKGVLIFTGFEQAMLRASANAGVRRLLAACDLLIAGPYRRDQPCRHPLLASANQELVFLTERYRGGDLGPRRLEYRIGAGGEVTITGFPQPPSAPGEQRPCR